MKNSPPALSSERAGRARACAPLLVALLVGLPLAAAAQATPPTQETAAAATASVSATAPSADEKHYRIGPGDVLDIRVFNKPQFSRDGVRVGERGMIRMPLLEGEIQAACRTEAELAEELTERYKEFLRHPQVDVFIKDYQSQPVAVLGAVREPSRFQLQRRVRLLELLSFAGGPSDVAGLVVQVVHTAPPSVCNAAAPEEVAAGVIENYKLSDTLRGDERANPFVLPGDVISVAEAEQAYVVGNVLRPSPIPLKERITVTRAIAMSGGLMPDTQANRVRIVRQTPGTTTATELFVDLKAIDRRQAEDVVLQAGDIVDVPVAGGKRLLRNLISAVVPAAGQLPVRVIPVH